MQIKIDIDCTPEEARSFLGLPDVAPMQAALMKEIERSMTSSLHAMEPEQLFKTWLPAGFQGLESIQQAFWKQMAGATGTPADKKKDK